MAYLWVLTALPGVQRQALDESAPVILAHTVKVDSDVAVTLHVEPDHNPKAGEPSQVWFLLTKAGGEVIPFSQCDCELTMDGQQHQGSGALRLQPPLTAVAAEQYQNLPGAEIVFPQPGAYTLTLQGTPKIESEFQPFKISFEVTVAMGNRSVATLPGTQTPDLTKPDAPDLGLIVVVTVILGLGLWGIYQWVRSNR